MADVLVESVQAVSESNDDAAADPASSQVQQPTVTTSPHATPGAPQTLSTHLSTRLDRTTICLPIVHGSVSFYLGKKAENKNEFQSHQWTLYLRGSNNEDLSHCIEKVVFQLHPSFAQPIREYTQPPYEVTEKGWGEFEAQVRIYWKDPSETMTMVTHGIKLYPPGAPVNAVPTNTEEPVVSEVYDEIVFTNPDESFFQDLQAIGESPTIEKEYSQSKYFAKFSDTDDSLALLEAQKFLQDQLALIKERYRRVNEEMEAIDQELASVVEPSQKSSSIAHSKQQSRAPVAMGTSSSKGVPNKVTGKKHKGTPVTAKATQPVVQGGGAPAIASNSSVLQPSSSGTASKKLRNKGFQNLIENSFLIGMWL